MNTNSRPNTHKLPVGPKPRLRFFSGTFDSPFFIAAHTERVPDRRLALWLEAILGCGWLDGGGGWGGVGWTLQILSWTTVIALQTAYKVIPWQNGRIEVGGKFMLTNGCSC